MAATRSRTNSAMMVIRVPLRTAGRLADGGIGSEAGVFDVAVGHVNYPDGRNRDG
jgi:hypothetical protein